MRLTVRYQLRYSARNEVGCLRGYLCQFVNIMICFVSTKTLPHCFSSYQEIVDKILMIFMSIYGSLETTVQ